MTLVVDASVAVKWFFEERGHEQARALLSEDNPLIAPSIILAEIANAAWKRFRRREIDRSDADAVVTLMIGPFSDIAPIEVIAAAAARLSLDLDHPIYDCFYIALALRERAPLVTADRKVWTIARRRDIEATLLDAA